MSWKQQPLGHEVGLQRAGVVWHWPPVAPSDVHVSDLVVQSPHVSPLVPQKVWSWPVRHSFPLQQPGQLSGPHFWLAQVRVMGSQTPGPPTSEQVAHAAAPLPQAFGESPWRQTSGPGFPGAQQPSAQVFASQTFTSRAHERRDGSQKSKPSLMQSLQASPFPPQDSRSVPTWQVPD